MTFELLTVIALICSTNQSLVAQRECQRKIIRCVEDYQGPRYVMLSNPERVAKCVEEK